MTTYTAVFWNLADEILDEKELDQLRVLTIDPSPGFEGPLTFDRYPRCGRTLRRS